jgi:hypothetical protein
MEPQYLELTNGMKQGDFLIIGFGHNDEKTESGRFTNANGTYQEKGSFACSLYENYIKKAQVAGCKVILCTPIVRRTADGSWKAQDLHVTQTTSEFPGGDYPEAIRILGKELSIPVVDMTEITKRLYDQLGSQETIFLHAWPSDKKISVDNTHTNIWGARVNAYHVLKEIKRLEVAGLAQHIIGLEKDAPVPEKEKYLESNPEYIPTVYSGELKDSLLWKDVDGWKGTVFGDIMEQPTKEHFTLEEAKGIEVNGASARRGMRIAVRNSVGKIAGVSDGLAMYYKKVPVSASFTLTAKAVIHDYFSNDQVSFGLMVRDDMYIDKATADVLGDYVAAAPLMLTHGEHAWNCFARKSGVLTQGGECRNAYKPGDVVDLKIEGTTDGYACTFGKEETITGGFDFKLTSIDPEYVYVGMFVARNADVTFLDVDLKTF